MFDNIGGKIKTVASVAAWIGIIAFVIYGIVLLVNGAVVVGILTAVLGVLGSWIGSFTLYGFGELIENSAEIIGRLDKLDMLPTQNGSNDEKEEMKEKHPECTVLGDASSQMSPSGMWVCSKCGQRQAAYRKVCWQCNAAKPTE